MSRLRRVLVPLLLFGCGGPAPEWPGTVTPAARYADLHPFRAGHLLPDDDGFWVRYDPARRGDSIRAALQRLRGLGARQVVIEAPFAWTAEPVADKHYAGFASGNVVYKEGASPAASYSKTCQTGDMRLAPLYPPAPWLQGDNVDPEALSARAREVVRSLLALARQEQLAPVLYLRNSVVPAHPRACQPCGAAAECEADGFDPQPLCVKNLDSGVCQVVQGDNLFLDPSRDLAGFFAAYRQHAVAMAQVARQGGAELLVLGGGSPYLSGGGQATFADNTAMEAHKAELTQHWRTLIQAVRDALPTGAPPAAPLLTYAAQDTLTELRPLGATAPRLEWDLVDFWPQLDAVAVDFTLPGRPSGAAGVSRDELQAADLIGYMEAHGQDTDGFTNYRDLERFAARRGFSLRNLPLLLLSDGVPALPYNAAQPEVLLGTPGQDPDFGEQRKFIEARLVLSGQYAQRGWLLGTAFYAFQANVEQGVPAFGGAGRARLPGSNGGFNSRLDYYSLFDTPAEPVFRKFWGPDFRSRP